MHSQHTRALLALSLLLLPSCAGPRAYHLRINAAQSSESRICDTTVDADPDDDDDGVEEDGENTTGDTNCRSLATTLEAPGSVSITVEGATSDHTYDLEIDETRIAPNGATPEGVFAGFIENLVGLTGVLGTQLTALRDDPTIAGLITEDQLRDLASQAPGAVRDALRGAIPALATTDTSTPPNAEALTYNFVENERLELRPLPLDNDGTDVPFVRSRELTVDDLATLEAAHYPADEVTRFAVYYCREEAWGPARGFGTTLVALARDTALGPEVVLGALGLDPETVLGAFEGNAVGIETRIRERLAAAATTLEDPSATLEGEQAVIRQLALEAAFAHDIATCRHNLDLFAQEATLNAADSEALASAMLELTRLNASVTDAREAYDAFVLPFITERALDYLEGHALADGTIDFGTRTLHAGSLGISLRDVDDDRAIASLELEVRNSPGFAVSVGPVFSLSAFHDIREQLAPAEGTLPAGRVIRQTSELLSVSVAISLHVSLWHDLEHHFGLMVGYPIGSTDTPATALAGVSYRYAPYGLQVGLGLQLFERITLVGSTQDPTAPLDASARRVDLRTPGNELLTLDDVTTSEVFPAAFFLVGLSTDFLSTL